MPTRYDNMNTPDPHRQSKGVSRNGQSGIRSQGRGNASQSSSRERPVRSQTPVRREGDARKTRQPQIKKSQTLETAKQQAYITKKYSLQSGAYHSSAAGDTYRRSYTTQASATVRPQAANGKPVKPQGRSPAAQSKVNQKPVRKNASAVQTPSRPVTSKAPAGKRPVSPKKKGNSGKLKRRGIFFSIVAVIMISLLSFWMSRYYEPVIVPGVSINHMDMSGKTKEEAVQMLEQQLDDMRNSIHVTLKCEDSTWLLTQDDFSVEAPIEHTVNLAMQVAREGSVFKRMLDGWNARQNMPHYETAISITDNGMSDHIEAIASELDVPAVNATMNFRPDSGDFTFEEGTNGYEVDQERIKEAVLQGLNDGYMVNTIEFGLNPTEPTVKKADLAKATSRISFFETEVNGSQNRIDNVRLALSRFNGMVIAPGETVSFNQTTGERSEANGYKEAPGINADKGLEDTLGGGVCQASTTLYNAVLQAGCSIQERHRHSFPSSYVKEGFDAMVNWSTNDDLRFTNTSDMPIFIRTYVGKHEDGTTYAQVWVYGKKLENGITLSRKSVIVSEVEKPEPELIQDTEGKYADYVTYNDEAYIAVASRKGMTVEAYLITKDSDGNVIKEKLLHTDNFAAITGKHYYGTKKRPDDVPKTVKSGCYLLKTEEEESNSPD